MYEIFYDTVFFSACQILIEHCAWSSSPSFKNTLQTKKTKKLGYMLAKCVAALDKWRDIWVSLREYKHDNL